MEVWEGDHEGLREGLLSFILSLSRAPEASSGPHQLLVVAQSFLGRAYGWRRALSRAQMCSSFGWSARAILALAAIFHGTKLQNSPLSLVTPGTTCWPPSGPAVPGKRAWASCPHDIRALYGLITHNFQGCSGVLLIYMTSFSASFKFTSSQVQSDI